MSLGDREGEGGVNVFYRVTTIYHSSQGGRKVERGSEGTMAKCFQSGQRKKRKPTVHESIILQTLTPEVVVPLNDEHRGGDICRGITDRMF